MYDEDGPTGAVDYLQIQRFRDQKASAGAKGFFYNQAGGAKGATKPSSTTCYIACPPSIATSYGVKYDTVNFGRVGVAAANMLAQGSALNADAAAEELAQFAGDQVPEAILKGVASATKGIGSLAGSDFGGDANDLLAMSQGKIFNPFEEMVFQGMEFREHKFQFKMVARNSGEAGIIGAIIRYLKAGMLSSFNPQDETAGGNTDIGEGNLDGRYLHVPDKFRLSFKRLSADGKELMEVPHYKFNPCFLAGLDVNYTPDGQYTSFADAEGTPNVLQVPAVAIQLSFKEVAYVTKELALQGY